MGSRKKHLNILNGFYRVRNGFEINWSIYDWALPFGFGFTDYLFSVSFLCFTFFFPRKTKDNSLGGEVSRW